MKLFKNFNLGEIEVRPSVSAAEAAGMAASIFLMAEKSLKFVPAGNLLPLPSTRYIPIAQHTSKWHLLQLLSIE